GSAGGLELGSSLRAGAEDCGDFARPAREQVDGGSARGAGADGGEGTAFEQGDRLPRRRVEDEDRCLDVGKSARGVGWKERYGFDRQRVTVLCADVGWHEEAEGAVVWD